MRVSCVRRIAAMLGGGLLGTGLAGSVPAQAGSAVTPTLVQLANARQTGEVTLYNGGAAPMLVEASVVSWRQEDGHDAFTPTGDFVIAPAIVEIRPGSGQIFRVRARAALAGGERTYRLRLEDISPQQPGSGIGMRVRHDLPLIIAVPGGTPDLVFASCPGRPTGCLRATNLGTALAKVTRLTVVGSAGEKSIDAVATILAGSWHEWAIPSQGVGQLRDLRVQTAQGTLSVPLNRP